MLKRFGVVICAIFIGAYLMSRSMWWKNVKAVALMVFVILVVVYVILSIACGGPGLSQC